MPLQYYSFQRETLSKLIRNNERPLSLPLSFSLIIDHWSTERASNALLSAGSNQSSMSQSVCVPVNTARGARWLTLWQHPCGHCGGWKWDRTAGCALSPSGPPHPAPTELKGAQLKDQWSQQSQPRVVKLHREAGEHHQAPSSADMSEPTSQGHSTEWLCRWLASCILSIF